MGGKFTLSDDSHGISQVATNYSRALTYLESLGVTEVWTFERLPAEANGANHGVTSNGASPRTALKEKAVPLSAIRRSFP